MLKDSVEQKLNEQINFELFSAYLYYSMANWFDGISLPGAAHWMRAQAMEEMMHVARFNSYVNDRRGTVKLMAVDAPQAEWDSPLAAFTDSYEHECLVSERINALVDEAQAASDHATMNFLQWFVQEQVEEEASVDEIVQRLKLVAKSEGGLFMFDRELAARALPALAPDAEA